MLIFFHLSTIGVKCAVLEKSATFSEHPQAHFINNRSMEVIITGFGISILVFFIMLHVQLIIDQVDLIFTN